MRTNISEEALLNMIQEAKHVLRKDGDQIDLWGRKRLGILDADQYAEELGMEEKCRGFGKHIGIFKLYQQDVIEIVPMR